MLIRLDIHENVGDGVELVVEFVDLGLGVGGGRAGWVWGLVGGSVKLPEKKNYWETFRKTIKRGEVSICCD